MYLNIFDTCIEECYKLNNTDWTKIEVYVLESRLLLVRKFVKLEKI